MNFFFKVIFILLWRSVKQFYFLLFIYGLVLSLRKKMSSVRVAQRYHYQTGNYRNSRITRGFWKVEALLTYVYMR